MTTKTLLYYFIRNMRSVMTGEKFKRAFPILNGKVTLDQICQLMVKESGMVDCKFEYLRAIIIALFTKILELLKEGKAVYIDEYVRIVPTIKGEVDAITGRPNENTTMGVAFSALKQMTLPISNFEMVCREGESAEPKIIDIRCVDKGSEPNKIVRGKGLLMIGRNLCYTEENGDTMSASYMLEGIERTVALVPSSVNEVLFMFQSQEAFDTIPDGTELEITLRTHMDVAESAFSIASRKVVLVAK